MGLKGRITSVDGEYITVKLPLNETGGFKAGQALNISLVENRLISADQRKKIYATFNDISNYTGYTPDETKLLMKYSYIAVTGCNYFSLSNVDMTTARYFLEYIIEFCISFGVPCADSLLSRTPDVARYIYACLINKKCCICGGYADLHHVDRVGIGRNRDKIVHIGMRAEPLCRTHHNEAHDIGQKSFDEKHYIFGIIINEAIANIYGLLNTG